MFVNYLKIKTIISAHRVWRLQPTFSRELHSQLYEKDLELCQMQEALESQIYIVETILEFIICHQCNKHLLNITLNME